MMFSIVIGFLFGLVVSAIIGRFMVSLIHKAHNHDMNAMKSDMLFWKKMYFKNIQINRE